MAALINSFVTFLVLNLITEGLCDCSLDTINIGTVRSGREIQGKLEWNVTVFNNCACTQKQIELTCKGFKTVENVDPSILLKEGENCLINNGNPMKGFTSVSFSYAWDPPFLMFPAASVTIDC